MNLQVVDLLVNENVVPKGIIKVRDTLLVIPIIKQVEFGRILTGLATLTTVVMAKCPRHISQDGR